MTGDQSFRETATPRTSPGFAARLLSDPRAQLIGARLALKAAQIWSGPIRLGQNVFAFRYSDALEVLRRDLDFRIGPVNEARMDAVNGPFILGMDRGATLIAERAALYQAMGRLDLEPVRKAIAARALERVSNAGDTIDVVGGYARPIAAETATAIFGIGPPSQPALPDLTRALFGHIFLNLSDDEAVKQKALAKAPQLRGWLQDEIARRRAAGQHSDDLMGKLLDGPLDDDGVRRTLGGMIVGSIDTTASSVAKIVAVIGRDPELAKAVAADVDQPQRLRGWCWEALRRWPHNPLVMRSAAADTELSGVAIKAGDKVWVVTLAAMQDNAAFPTPSRLDPDRPPHLYMHFGAGLHPCAGRAISGDQIPLLVGALVRRGLKSVGEIACEGSFPDRLTVTFRRSST